MLDICITITPHLFQLPCLERLTQTFLTLLDRIALSEISHSMLYQRSISLFLNVVSLCYWEGIFEISFPQKYALQGTHVYKLVELERMFNLAGKLSGFRP